jgi:hypothetical protein
MPQREDESVSTNTTQSNMAPEQVSQRGKGRKFFQHMQPTFAIELPTTSTKLEFLDENDPAKRTIVRKKAREWVNKNKDMTNKCRQRQKQSSGKGKAREADYAGSSDVQLQRRKSNKPITMLGAFKAEGLRQFDPFNILPDIGRKYSHVVEFCESRFHFCLKHLRLGWIVW